jgi:hypothetical protein
MDWINLLIRAFAFVATIWILMEFIITCSVPTPIAASVIAIAALTTLALFFFLRRDKARKCSQCSGVYFPKKK